MDLGSFFDHVYQWAEILWTDRVEATEETQEIPIQAPQKALEVQGPAEGKATYPGQPLSAQQKEFSFG